MGCCAVWSEPQSVATQNHCPHLLSRERVRSQNNVILPPHFDFQCGETYPLRTFVYTSLYYTICILWNVSIRVNRELHYIPSEFHFYSHFKRLLKPMTDYEGVIFIFVTSRFMRITSNISLHKIKYRILLPSFNAFSTTGVICYLADTSK